MSAERQDLTLKLFGETVDYTSNDVNQHLDRLERKGLVLRRRMTTDTYRRRRSSG
jgi:DNA-binding MarR family transcriptional regulator